MNSTGKKTSYIICLLLLASCTNNGVWPNLGYSEPTPPAEEILISNEQFDKPYRILGPVEYTLKTRTHLLSSQVGIREQAIDLLKQQTYARFGDEVDAIIDTRVAENTINDYDGKLLITRITGMAISFVDELPRSGKSGGKRYGRHKPKSAKKILVVNKAKTAKKDTEKTSPEEVEITPEEILK